MKWTEFMDMHSGGGQKLKWHHIFIQAPEEKAEIIFQNRFNRNPNRVTCSCCGADYSISEWESLEQATAYERACRYAYFDKKGKEIPKEKAWVPGKGCINGAYGKWVEEQDTEYGRMQYDKYRTLEEYTKDPGILIINASEIKPKERKGALRKEGYCWCDQA